MPLTKSLILVCYFFMPKVKSSFYFVKGLGEISVTDFISTTSLLFTVQCQTFLIKLQIQSLTCEK